MAQSRAYSLLLDTDLRCHVNRSSLRANPTMKSTQIITCGNLELLLESMTQVRSESNVCERERRGTIDDFALSRPCASGRKGCPLRSVPVQPRQVLHHLAAHVQSSSIVVPRGSAGDPFDVLAGVLLREARELAPSVQLPHPGV